MFIRIMLGIALIAACSTSQAQQKTSTLGKPTFPKLEYVNMNAELGLPTDMLRGFGMRVDEGVRAADASVLAAQAVLLAFAEDISGKKSKTISALRILEQAARIAEEQQNEKAAAIVIAASKRIPDAELIAEKLVSGMSLFTRMRGDGGFIGFVKVVNQCDRVLDVYIDGKYVGFLYGGDESTYSTGNGTTMGRVNDAFGNTISETITIRQEETFVWTITP